MRIKEVGKNFAVRFNSTCFYGGADVMNALFYEAYTMMLIASGRSSRDTKGFKFEL